MRSLYGSIEWQRHLACGMVACGMWQRPGKHGIKHSWSYELRAMSYKLWAMEPWAMSHELWAAWPSSAGIAPHSPISWSVLCETDTTKADLMVPLDLLQRYIWNTRRTLLLQIDINICVCFWFLNKYLLFVGLKFYFFHFLYISIYSWHKRKFILRVLAILQWYNYFAPPSITVS